jgi:hypothetical protein
MIAYEVDPYPEDYLAPVGGNQPALLDDEEPEESVCHFCGWTGELLMLEFGGDACPDCGHDLYAEPAPY